MASKELNNSTMEYLKMMFGRMQTPKVLLPK